MNTFWVFAHIDGDGIKHYRQFESPAGPYYATARQADGIKAVGGKGMTTGKHFRAKEHAGLTVSHILVREIVGIGLGRFIREHT